MELALQWRSHVPRNVLKQWIGGFLDVLEILGWSFTSLRRFKFLPGKTGRTQAMPLWRQQRRKRHDTGNSSIHLFLLASFGAMIFFVDANEAKAGPRLSAAEEKALQAVGDDFEAYMLDFLYRQMRDGVDFAGEGNPFAASGAEKIFRSMRDEAMMKSLAKRRPLGFGELVTKQFSGRGGIPERTKVNQNTNAVGVDPVASASLTPGG